MSHHSVRFNLFIQYQSLCVPAIQVKSLAKSRQELLGQNRYKVSPVTISIVLGIKMDFILVGVQMDHRYITTLFLAYKCIYKHCVQGSLQGLNSVVSKLWWWCGKGDKYVYPKRSKLFLGQQRICSRSPVELKSFLLIRVGIQQAAAAAYYQMDCIVS